MRRKHLGIVHLIYMVAGQDKYIIRIVAVDKAQVLIYRICRALVPLSAALCLIRREYGHSALRTVKIPWAAVTYVFVQHERLILREHTDGVYPRVYAVGHREVDNSVFAAEADGRLCRSLGQCI